MTISSIKDLSKVIQLCRKTGVTSIEIDGIKLQLAPVSDKRRNIPVQIDANTFPEASIVVPAYNGEISPPETFKDEGLTEDQLLFYSARPEVPGEQ